MIFFCETISIQLLDIEKGEDTKGTFKIRNDVYIIWTKTEQHEPQKGGEGATKWQTRPVNGKYRFHYIQVSFGDILISKKRTAL